jgi:hypothetical protein
MAMTVLKLTDPDIQRSPYILPLERRSSDRHPLTGKVTALRNMDGHNTGILRKICSLTLTDMSESGVGVVSDEPMDLDSTITILFPPHGPEAGYNITGQVVRCFENTDNKIHHVGIQFSSRMAA